MSYPKQEERKNIQMNQEQRATEFAVFCIENTAIRLQCNGFEVFQELQRTDGIRKFLFPSYPALHTQSKEYIVDEVLKYICKKNPTFTQTYKKEEQS